MHRRTVIKALLVASLLLGLSLSTAGARQIWTEQHAQAGLEAARSRVEGSLKSAVAVGLLPGELAPYRSRLAHLSSQSPPSSIPFWSSSRASFYDSQARAYRRLARDIRLGMRAVTQQTRGESSGALRSLAHEIDLARTLDVDPGAAPSVLSRDQESFHAAATPRQYRTVRADAERAASRLDSPVRSRQQYVAGVLRAAGNSASGVDQRADAEVQSVGPRLDLLALLTSRAGNYRTALARLDAAVHAQPTPFAAAVKEAAVSAVVAEAAADYARTVPQKMIVVSTEQQSAQMYENGRVIYSTPVTTGGPELPTDHGVFHVYLKLSPFTFHSPWGPDSPYYYPPTPVTYWMPFDGGEGLHDASWRSNFGPGSNLAPTDLGTGNTILGTHGCVNLPFAAAQFIWDWAPVGTTVVVV